MNFRSMSWFGCLWSAGTSGSTVATTSAGTTTAPETSTSQGSTVITSEYWTCSQLQLSGRSFKLVNYGFQPSTSQMKSQKSSKCSFDNLCQKSGCQDGSQWLNTKGIDSQWNRLQWSQCHSFRNCCKQASRSDVCLKTDETTLQSREAMSSCSLVVRWKMQIEDIGWREMIFGGNGEDSVITSKSRERNWVVHNRSV